MAEVEGYALRITSSDWVDHVFDVAVYYTNLHRKWKPDQTAIFIHRTELGDAIVGYGVIETVCRQNELPEDEKVRAEKWKEALLLRYVFRFKKPLPIKETFLGEPRFRGRYVHGLALSKKQLDSILKRAKSWSR